MSMNNSEFLGLSLSAMSLLQCYTVTVTIQIFYLQYVKISSGYKKAKIESEFNYKACCNDNTGLQVLGTEVYQPSTCSQRTCFYDKYLPFSLWISKQVR